MPIYEYRCLKCGHITEKLRKLSDPPLKTCERCSGKLEKLFSRTSFQLKGEGWFAHDYGSAPKKEKSDGKDKDGKDKKEKKTAAKGSDSGGKSGSGSDGSPSTKAAASG